MRRDDVTRTVASLPGSALLALACLLMVGAQMAATQRAAQRLQVQASAPCGAAAQAERCARTLAAR